MIRYLQDIPGLEALDGIAGDFGVELTLRGGVARRAYTGLVRGMDAAHLDLFNLVPFMANIDLTHSGASETTALIVSAIHTRVPLAECFRWDVRASAQMEVFRQARPYQALIPVNDITLSTASGFSDPSGAERDIRDRQYRFVRSPHYRESPLFRANRDLEVFSGILYLRMLLESNSEYWWQQPGSRDLRDVFVDSMAAQTLGRLQESASLRARLHYLLQSVSPLINSEDAYKLVEQSGLYEFVSFVDDVSDIREAREPGTLSEPLLSDLESRTIDPAAFRHRPFSRDLHLSHRFAMTASQHLRGDFFRLPQLIRVLELAKHPDRELKEALAHTVNQTPFLADGVDVVQASPWTPVFRGVARSTRLAPGLTNEMCHFALVDRDPSNAQLSDEDISMLVFVHRAGSRGSIDVIAPPACSFSRPFSNGSGFPGRVRTLRVPLGGFLEQLPALEADGPIHVAFLLVARRVTENAETTEAQ